MTLGFQTKWGEEMGGLAGMPTYFVEKIWDSLRIEVDEDLFFTYDKYRFQFLKMNTGGWELNNENYPMPKSHTIRHDSSNRWREGMDIHFVINNRTKKRFQFAPVLKCTGVQFIDIKYITLQNKNHHACIFIDEVYRGSFHFSENIFKHQIANFLGYRIERLNFEELVKNDGFNSVDDFFKFFNKDFKGKIIHWAGLRY